MTLMATLNKVVDVDIDMEELFEEFDTFSIAAELENQGFTCIHESDMLDAEELDILMQLLDGHTNIASAFVIREKLLLMRFGSNNLCTAA